MLKTIKKLIYDLLLVFLNYFVARIPCWHIRKLFYFIFGLKIGKGSRINQRVFLYNPWRIKIGSNTIVNSFAILDGRGGLTIGNNTSVSMRAVLYTASHKTYSDTFEHFEKPTVVEDCCWICTNAIILPGSQIKNLAVIGTAGDPVGIVTIEDILEELVGEIYDEDDYIPRGGRHNG